MILAGRRLNDNMPLYVAGEVIKLMTRKRIHVDGSRVLVLGLTFKENCPDVRNTKVVDVVRELERYGANVDVVDPWANAAEAQHEYGLKPSKTVRKGAKYDAVVLAVAHNEFKELGALALRKLGKKNHVLYDIKHLLPASETDGRL
jgi:UDP-N-acetyl-D-galactosamine dehydrogenase